MVDGSQSELPRFALLVHPLMGWHRRFIGVRTAKLGIAAGYRDGSSAWDVAPLCELELVGVAKGVMMAIPMTPDQLLGDQERVLQRLLRAVEMAKELGPLHAVGLGALCAVVAGRGTALGAQLDIPVTTGAAATAWTLAENTRAVVNQLGGGPVAVVGSAGVVGNAVAAKLTQWGIPVSVDSKRGAKGLNVTICSDAVSAVKDAPLLWVLVRPGPLCPRMRCTKRHCCRCGDSGYDHRASANGVYRCLLAKR